jgi:large subunit ribosomal protein L4
LKIIEQLAFDQPRTKEMVKILTALGADSSVLVVTEAPEGNVIKSAQNLLGIKTIPAGLLNVVDLLSHKIVLMTVAAVHRVEQLWGQEVPEGEVSASV